MSDRSDYGLGVAEPTSASREAWANELRRARNMWRGLAIVLDKAWTPDLIRERNAFVHQETEKKLGPVRSKETG